MLSILLVGCRHNATNVEKYRNNYIEERNLIYVQDVLLYDDKPYFEGTIFIAKTENNTENMYYFEDLPGGGEGKWGKGKYTGGLVRINEDCNYRIYEGEDYGYDKSYFVGILCKEVKDVLYKNESIDFQTVDITLNGEKISLTVWLMEFVNGQNIEIKDFSYE